MADSFLKKQQINNKRKDMKKILILLILIGLASCKTAKSGCDAYGSTKSKKSLYTEHGRK